MSQKSLALLCIAHGLRSCSDTAWTYVLPLFFAQASPGSLRPTTAVGMALSFGVILLAPSISQTRGFLSQPRWIAVLVVCENICLVAGGGLTIAAAQFGENLMQQPLFWLGLAFMAVDGGISSLLVQVISKDYVRQMYGDDEKNTASANGWLLRTDLGVNVFTFWFLGRLSEWGVLDEGPSAIVAMGIWHLIAAGIVLTVLASLHSLDPTLTSTVGDTAEGQEQKSFFFALANGGRAAVQLEWVAKRAIIAFVLLWFTVVSTGGLMSTYLRTQGVSAGSIANMRSLGELSGFLGTVVAPPLVGSLGVVSAGVWLQRSQTVCVLVAFLCIAHPSFGTTALMGAVVASRVGLWGYDLAERSLIQLRVEPKSAILVFNFERALAELFFLAMYIITFILDDPEDFTILVALSALAVTTSSIILAIPGSQTVSMPAEGDVALALS